MASIWCPGCGAPDCPGRIAVDFCPSWQEAGARNARGEYLQTQTPDWLTPSADLPACRAEDPARAASPPATPTRPKPGSEEG